MRSKSAVENSHLLKYAGYPGMQENCLRITGNFALGPEYARIIMSPMQQYRGGPTGHATAYHAYHYARPARGGVGLVMVESTAVAIEGRLFQDDLGIFEDSHINSLAGIVEAVHAHGAKIGIQLCHGGRKATPRAEEVLVGPSAIAFGAGHDVPMSMDKPCIMRVIGQFAAGACRAVAAGFDLIELHAAHGYLIHQFLSPLSNQRTDDYGGSIDHRRRFLHEIMAAVREAVGGHFPLTVRISASDHQVGGLTPDTAVESLRPLLQLGLDAVDVSSGGLLPQLIAPVAPEYQVPFAAQLRQALGVPAIAVGLIRGADRAEAILASGQADFIAFGRPILERPDYAMDLGRALGSSI